MRSGRAHTMPSFLPSLTPTLPDYNATEEKVQKWLSSGIGLLTD